MTIKFIISLIPLIISSINFQYNENEWGLTGHRVVAQVAENHLTQTTKNSIRLFLNGKSLVSISNYADDIKSDKRFDKYKPWHYLNIKLNNDYQDIMPNKKGDVVQAINYCINILKDNNQSKKEKIFYLKLLVHFVGDIHQPLHVGRAQDKGGNNIKVKWFGKGTNLHRVWDSQIINSHQMSYTELSKDLNVLSLSEINKIKSDSINTWVKESQQIAKLIYQDAETETNLGFSYSYKYLNIVRLRLLKGGIRLASILDDIFKK
jgi:hypothetical protein